MSYHVCTHLRRLQKIELGVAVSSSHNFSGTLLRLCPRLSFLRVFRRLVHRRLVFRCHFVFRCCLPPRVRPLPHASLPLSVSPPPPPCVLLPPPRHVSPQLPTLLSPKHPLRVSPSSSSDPSETRARSCHSVFVRLPLRLSRSVHVDTRTRTVLALRRLHFLQCDEI